LPGERDLAETIELVKIKTRQFAKRQMTWFKRQLNLEWIKLESGGNLNITAESISHRLQKISP
jgi:tRNA dimethylallyltransferase